MLYQYLKHTQSARIGDRVNLDPLAIQTAELLRGGFICPVAQPIAEARETKVVVQSETKRKRGRPRKVAV